MRRNSRGKRRCRTGVGPGGGDNFNGVGIVVVLVDADLLGLKGDVEAEVVAAWEEPIANGGINPRTRRTI